MAYYMKSPKKSRKLKVKKSLLWKYKYKCDMCLFKEENRSNIEYKSRNVLLKRDNKRNSIKVNR